MAAKQKRGTNAPVAAVPVSEAGPRNHEPNVAPPQKSLWQLIVSGVLVGLWLIFLAWMAFTG
jgi:hypothetical protein